MKCLLCKKELVCEQGIVYDGGSFAIDFGYGSRHDQLAADAIPDDNPLKVLKYQVRGFICDDCFEANVGSFEGYEITTTRKETRIV